MPKLYKKIIGTLCLFGASLVVNAQSLEQLSELRARAAGNQSQPQAAQSQLSAIEIQGSRSLPTTSSVSTGLPNYNQQPRSNIYLPGELTVSDVFPLHEQIENPPFAANLFLGGYESERTDSLNENYQISAGDKINVWLWGAVNYSDVVTVDNQGNIFIPNIGPLQIAGTPANKVSQVVSQHIRNVYTKDVNIYVNLLTSTPISIYVAGPVIRPGQYAGQSSDSILYFLKRAGGIDFVRGSFRQIQIIRDDKTIANIDLYDFYRTGQLTNVSFKDGDTVLVQPIGDTVIVSAGARNSFTYELLPAELQGREVNKYAQPSNYSSHVSISGVRNNHQVSQYLTLDEFQTIELQAGDTITYISDNDVENYQINIAGSYEGASQFTLPRGSRLHDVMHLISIDPSLSDVGNVYLLRESVAQKQKEMISDALDRLERSVYTAPVASTGEGSIRVQEAQLIADFVARARNIEPLGKVIVSQSNRTANILLEPNDTIVIPGVTDLVHVGGEVMLPQAVVYNDNADLEDYIAWSGGFTERANDARIMVIKQNGTVLFSDVRAQQPDVLNAGDQVVVLPKIDAKNLQAIKDITQVIYQIAIAANVATN